MNTHPRRVVGQSLPRLDGIGKVTGKHVYAADFTLPGMLFGKVLRSHRAHALMRKLDVSRAAAISSAFASQIRPLVPRNASSHRRGSLAVPQLQRGISLTRPAVEDLLHSTAAKGDAPGCLGELLVSTSN